MSIYLFFGDDTYSHRKKLSFWKDEFEKKHGDMNMETMDAENTSANDIFSSCMSTPFLGDKRLLIVKNFVNEAKAEEREKIVELLNQEIPDFTVLVFSEIGQVDKRTALYKKLVKIAQVVEFPKLEGLTLTKWILNEVKARNGVISQKAAQLLADIKGGDLFALENEIAKLVAYCEKREINVDDVELMIDTTLATSIFKFTDALSTKNIKNATSTLHNLIHTGQDPYSILYMIMRQFRIITCVKDLATQGLRQQEIASTLKVHPFVVSNTLGQVKNFSIDQLKTAYSLLIELDSQLKSGEMKVLVNDKRDFALALDRLVVKLCI